MKARIGVSLTVGGYVDVESAEQKAEYEQKFRDNNYADIEDQIEQTHFEADVWDEVLPIEEPAPYWTMVCREGDTVSVLGLFVNRKASVAAMEEYIVEAIRDFKDDFPDDEVNVTRKIIRENDFVTVNDVTWQSEIVAVTK